MQMLHLKQKRGIYRQMFRSQHYKYSMMKALSEIVYEMVI